MRKIKDNAVKTSSPRGYQIGDPAGEALFEEWRIDPVVAEHRAKANRWPGLAYSLTTIPTGHLIWAGLCLSRASLGPNYFPKILNYKFSPKL